MNTISKATSTTTRWGGYKGPKGVLDPKNCEWREERGRNEISEVSGPQYIYSAVNSSLLTGDQVENLSKKINFGWPRQNASQKMIAQMPSASKHTRHKALHKYIYPINVHIWTDIRMTKIRTHTQLPLDLFIYLLLERFSGQPKTQK